LQSTVHSQTSIQPSIDAFYFFFFSHLFADFSSLLTFFSIFLPRFSFHLFLSPLLCGITMSLRTICQREQSIQGEMRPSPLCSLFVVNMGNNQDYSIFWYYQFCAYMCSPVSHYVSCTVGEVYAGKMQVQELI